MKPATYDIYTKRGAAYNPSAFIVSSGSSPMNLTGYTAKAEIRETCDNTTVVATFDITITPLTGAIKLYLSDDITGAILATGRTLREKSIFYWDLLLTPASGESFYLLEGSVYVTPRVTR